MVVLTLSKERPPWLFMRVLSHILFSVVSKGICGQYGVALPNHLLKSQDHAGYKFVSYIHENGETS